MQIEKLLKQPSALPSSDAARLIAYNPAVTGGVARAARPVRLRNTPLT